MTMKRNSNDIAVGLAMGASRIVHAWMNPLVQLLRPIPPIAYIPLSILWFGLGNPPAIFLIALGAFFPVLMNTIAGVRHRPAAPSWPTASRWPAPGRSAAWYSRNMRCSPG
jgi:ABC-type anion transport system duplicated permease subunit